MGNLSEKVARALRRRIRSKAIRRLPSRASLARSFGVSEGTIRKVLRILEHEGLIQCTKGRTPEVTATKDFASRPSFSCSEREKLSRDILDSIITGQYRTGRPLPKIEYFTTRYGLSRSTVIDELQTLAGMGHVHKKGRSYIVGTPAPSPQFGSEPHPKATVLILMAGRRTWHRLRVPRTERFCLSFENEAYLQGVELKPVFLEKRISGSPMGLRETVALAQDLGSRYLGSLIPLLYEEFSECRAWINRLRSFGRPIVWFDRHGIPIPDEFQTKSIMKCCFSEDKALNTAIEHLVAFGHRKIIYACRELDEWAVERGERLRAIAQRKQDPVEIELCIQGYDDAKRSIEYFKNHFEHYKQSGSEEMRTQLTLFEKEAPQWSDLLPEAFEETYYAGNNLFLLVARLAGGSDHIQPFYGQTALLMRFGWMLELCRRIQRHNGTAVLIDSDSHCHNLLMNFRLAGIRIPEELSLLSFDNYQPFLTNAVSSVDFGFGSMGYWAYHALADDIAVPVDRNGIIRHTTHVNNYGTVDTAAWEKLRLRLELVLRRKDRAL